MGVCNDLLIRICILAWSMTALACFALNDTCLDFGSWGRIFEKWLDLDLCFVSCMYTYTTLITMTLLSYDLSSLPLISFVAFDIAHFIYERPIGEFFLIFPWFMHCQQGGEVCIWDAFGLHLGHVNFHCILSRETSGTGLKTGQTSFDTGGWKLVWPVWESG